MTTIKRRIRKNQCGLDKRWQVTNDIDTVVHTTVYNYRAIDCMGHPSTFSGHRDRMVFQVGKPLRRDGRIITKIERQDNYWILSVE